MSEIENDKENPFDILRAASGIDDLPSFFRSEKMSLCQMLLHRELAFDCLYSLGMEGKVQFINHSDGYYVACMNFVSEVQHCNEVLVILKELQAEIDDCQLTTVYYPNVDIDEIPVESDLQHIDDQLQEIQAELTAVLSEKEVLEEKQQIMNEQLFVLSRAEAFFMGTNNREAVMAWTNSMIMTVLHDRLQATTRDNQAHLGFYTGTILVEKFHAFERVCWRICRGNFYIRRAEIPSVSADSTQAQRSGRKFAFVILFVGDLLRAKIFKLCQSFSVQLHDYPQSADDRLEYRKRIALELADVELVLEQIEAQRRRILNMAAVELCIWRSKVTKSLMIYNAMNKMANIHQLENEKYLVAECWIPSISIAQTRTTLLEAALRSSNGATAFPPIITEQKFKTRVREPPTYFELNKFTRGFQSLVDAYGIASYKELNPAPYVIITFPFLFSIMFGDVGHGMIMMLFAAWMCLKEKKLEDNLKNDRNPNEVFGLIFAGRYVVLLMGIFSIYTGFIYNDIFSKALNIFGSHWRVNYTTSVVMRNLYLQLDPAKSENYLGTPYIFGMDPIWDISGSHAITTFNSLKMKIAIILGVIHMIFGLSLSAWNSRYFKNSVDLYFVFVPQIVFLCCLFLYLIILVFIKWSIFGGHYGTPYNSACAPSILIMFINMMLFKDGTKDVKVGCEMEMFTFQNGLQYILIFLAFCAIPVLLLGKPIQLQYEQKRNKAIKDDERKHKVKQATLSSVRKTLQIYGVEHIKGSASSALQDLEEETVDMAEVWIHQGIHCIESVLGSVSHTASYLRLWALSLAHNQLSSVLWTMVLRIPLTGQHGFMGSIILYAVFWLWTALTIAILVVMEGLSAFLHTLRLHWVEFQSKFYMGAGEKFMPFSFPITRKYE
ncbi:V-type proton ATPase 116 kDa subunit a 1 [Anastrepha ludens]|uniref:V-type proton ATPase 116 kDa subunit a 1 n=1 Tax=Anastrepha ludens TaxID=28586 RepID=UPI0023AFF9BC|nr:V-type proton ATPase 116 kDa subunit a 1 [Anastrepha ludens]